MASTTISQQEKQSAQTIVKITGTHTLLNITQDEAYARMQDPVALGNCMPGCEILEKTGDNEYKMKMEMAVASLSGPFEGSVKITDQSPPDHFRLIVEGTGKLGFVKGEGLLSFSPSTDGTNIAYEGDVQVGGAIATVGQRLIDATAKTMLKQFFEKIVA